MYVNDRTLAPLVFFCGMATLGVELAASRLLAPYFGSSLLVWANLIGVILIYLTLGYYLGGRWADRDPRPRTLYTIVCVAGFSVGVLPYVAGPILLLAVPALAQFDAGLGLLSFAGVVLLFALPLTLLGCVTPFALRLQARDVARIGSTGGRLSALSTLGSIVGVYVTVFWLIPAIGTRRTFVSFSLVLLVLSLWALWRNVGLRRALPYGGLAAIIILLGALDRAGTVKAAPGLLYETESQYNFIQVLEENGTRLLTVEEGQAYQSVYHPGAVLLGGYWDYYLIAPYVRSVERPRSLLVIGLAAGTIAKQYAAVYPEITIDGVEIDPAIIRVGREWFAMDEPQLNARVDDGRPFLRRTDKQYDVIAVDAYRQPYIPFHLATVEFFRELQPHLTERGVVVVNAARTPSDDRLVNALAATMRQAYPTVLVMDYPNETNNLIVAAPESISVHAFLARLATLRDPRLRFVAELASPGIHSAVATEPVFTDDRAPVENLIHSIILDYMLGAKQ